MKLLPQTDRVAADSRDTRKIWSWGGGEIITGDGPDWRGSKRLYRLYAIISGCGVWMRGSGESVTVYWDQKLNNSMYCDHGGSDASKVMVVDFEQVEFPTSFRPWKLGVNNEGARALMDDFRDIRDRYHGTPPARPWEHEPDSRDDENMPRTIQSSVISQSMNSGSIEALRYIAA
ncbi:hypothetical protein POX_f07379 [Penicillium oxalicum]|uniref:hypothetical protein n=1 Tax=Penicillium oxalicum TaxID=69781 RepID=UPI0020B65650|nr:hypothetical protein POX_f07379 [Penicillium oxalicum]KAI2787026.1 hypothetical protein POX_f07379 [Penicillium oxalicum]